MDTIEVSNFMQLSTVDLRGRVPAIGPLEFLRADVLLAPPAPIVRVYYAVRGHEQAMGLRVDIDKLVFLDHPFGEDALEDEEALATAIAAAVGEAQEAADAPRKRKHY